MKTKVRKAVFPAAGLGTRFLPATKALPKEMLALVDKPLIQYGVEEAVAAGCTEIIFVTGRGKSTMEDHFDASPELEAALAAKNKTALLEVARKYVRKDYDASDAVQDAFVLVLARPPRDTSPRGLGQPLPPCTIQ